MSDPKVPTQAPVFRDYNWRDLLARIDPDLDKPQNAYEFSNGRSFKDPGAQGGAYKQP